MKVSTLEINTANDTLIKTLGFTEGYHSEVVYNMGRRFLQRFWATFPTRGETWEHSKTYWDWWAQQWKIRNYEIVNMLGWNVWVPEVRDEVVVNYAKNIFNRVHEREIQNIYPPKPIRHKINRELTHTAIKIVEGGDQLGKEGKDA